MSKSNTLENGLLSLILQNVAFTGLGDAGGILPSVAAGSIYLSLHSADPGEAGDQTTNEIAYTGYARKAVARSSGEFTVSAGVGTNVNEQLFGACTAGSATATYFGIGTATSGAGKLLYSGSMSSLAISVGIQPRVIAGALTITED